MLKSIVLDDDELSRVVLRKLIEKSDGIELIAEFDDPNKALDALDELDCDVVFLDIEMPNMNGIEFIEKAKNIPQVVIVSSKADYAAEAFNFDVTDYLVKPLNLDRFSKSLQRIKEIDETVTKNNVSQSHMFFKKKNSFVRVDFKDIEFIEAYSDYVSIQSSNEKFVVLSTMKAIELRLPEDEFMRIHRSYIVRLDKIKSIEDNAVNIGGKTIPISRSCKSKFMDKMNIF